MTSPLSTTPSKTNDPLLSMGGPLGLPYNHSWGDASKWTFQPPDPQHVTAYQQLGCAEFLHPKTIPGFFQLGKLRIIQSITQNTEPLRERLLMDAAVLGGSLIAFGGTLFLANRSPDPKHYFLKNPATGVVFLFSISLGGAAFWKGLLETFEASIRSFLMRGTVVADIKRLNDCQWLQHFQQPSYVYQSGGEANNGEKSQMLALPNDIGLGTTAAVDAALTQKGWGLVDIAMGIAISTTIAAFVPPVASFPAGVATCHAVARAF